MQSKLGSWANQWRERGSVALYSVPKYVWHIFGGTWWIFVFRGLTICMAKGGREFQRPNYDRTGRSWPSFPEEKKLPSAVLKMISRPRFYCWSIIFPREFSKCTYKFSLGRILLSHQDCGRLILLNTALISLATHALAVSPDFGQENRVENACETNQRISNILMVHQR